MGYTVNGHAVWFILLITFLTSFLLVPFVKKLAFHIDAVDYPNQRRINKVPMPDLGGLAVFFSFLFGFLIFVQSNIPTRQSSPLRHRQPRPHLFH